MTAPDITRLRALYEAATGGEWVVMNAAIGVNPWIMAGNWTRANGSYVRGGCILNMVAHDEREQDAAFITAAHNAFPALLAAAERLAQYEAAMVSEEARETVAAAICEADLCGDAYAWADQATAALAALARIVEGGE